MEAGGRMMNVASEAARTARTVASNHTITIVAVSQQTFSLKWLRLRPKVAIEAAEAAVEAAAIGAAGAVARGWNWHVAFGKTVGRGALGGGADPGRVEAVLGCNGVRLAASTRTVLVIHVRDTHIYQNISC